MTNPLSNPLSHARDAFGARWPEVKTEVNGRDWGVIDTQGDGPCLLMIPGTLGRANLFWQQIEALAPVLRVISVSYPSDGSVERWAEDLLALLDQRGISSAAVLGSSLGGYLAQYIAAAFPSWVSHLFAANTLHSVAEVGARPPYNLDLMTAPIADLRAGFAGGLQAWKTAHPDQSDLSDLLMSDVNGGIPEAHLRMRLQAIKIGPELPPDPRPLTATTIIDSGDDPLIPAPIRDAVRARFPGAAGFQFQWGGHFPYVVRPDLYTALILGRMGLAAMPKVWADGSA